MLLSGYAHYTNFPCSGLLDVVGGVAVGSVVVEVELPGVSAVGVGVTWHVQTGLLEAGLRSCAGSGSDTDFQKSLCKTLPLGNKGNSTSLESPNCSITANSGLCTSQVFAKSMQNVKRRVVNHGILTNRERFFFRK